MPPEDFCLSFQQIFGPKILPVTHQTNVSEKKNIKILTSLLTLSNPRWLINFKKLSHHSSTVHNTGYSTYQGAVFVANLINLYALISLCSPVKTTSKFAWRSSLPFRTLEAEILAGTLPREAQHHTIPRLGLDYRPQSKCITEKCKLHILYY